MAKYLDLLLERHLEREGPSPWLRDLALNWAREEAK